MAYIKVLLHNLLEVNGEGGGGETRHDNHTRYQNLNKDLQNTLL
jgi:hypothetical protein